MKKNTELFTVVGARPQFIKASAVSAELRKIGITETLIHTGQHFDPEMSDVFFQELKMSPPAFHLGIHSLSHAAMTGKMMIAVEELILSRKPRAMLVYGDTNSTLAGALAAVKCGLPVFHVEAGLRSDNFALPEEINRQIVDKISDILFCPTMAAVDNLEREGVGRRNEKIVFSGDVMFDLALKHAPADPEKKAVKTILATFHRSTNVSDKQTFMGIIDALNELSDSFQVIAPLHPRTSFALREGKYPTRFQILPPQSYFNILKLIKEADVVLTDSGGLQKEACFCGRMTGILRNETEWTELVSAGAAQLLGTGARNIVDGAIRLLNTSFPGVPPGFGNGHAAECIAAEINLFLHGKA
jgi:UDP-GlcNAc3NAcA epimerase